MTANRLSPNERSIVDRMAAEPDADAQLHEAWLQARSHGLTALANYIELTRSLLPEAGA